MPSLKAPGSGGGGPSLPPAALMAQTLLGPWPRHPSLRLSVYMASSLCVSLSWYGHLHVRTPVILDEGPTLLRYGLILTDFYLS